MPLRLGEQPLADGLRKRRKVGLDQILGRPVVERPQFELRQSGPLEEALAPRARRGQESDPAARHRRATEPSTTALARSSHGTSSTTISTERPALARRSSDRVAFEMTSRSGAEPTPKPSATLSALTVGWTSSVNWGCSGSRSWVQPRVEDVGLKLDAPGT